MDSIIRAISKLITRRGWEWMVTGGDTNFRIALILIGVSLLSKLEIEIEIETVT